MSKKSMVYVQDDTEGGMSVILRTDTHLFTVSNAVKADVRAAVLNIAQALGVPIKDNTSE